MSTSTALVIEPADWRRLQQSSEFFFQDLDAQMKEHHRQFLEALMGHERQCFLNAQPYERTDQRVDQANGFYRRRLTTRLGGLELAVPRTRSGCFHTQVLPRYQRREPVINEALKQVFLLGVSTRQTGRVLATLASLKSFPVRKDWCTSPQLDLKRIEKVADFVKVGDVFDVKLLEIDDKKGRLNLSRKAVMLAEKKKEEVPQSN